ncbi:hypothetical protein F2Q68_00034652 [Brassica cretica]|uniref:Uncharacterized protein n=1 Tax=Brassica cretica TaxID=69181 RepID=A0A8S9H7N0_BRACR|nr:hypothetical protein F2Q68_00034652 [Brassica cretica]
MERDKIGAAPYDGCLHTLVEGIKPFVIRLGVKVLMTCFPARPLRSSLYVEVIRHVAADGILSGCREKTTMCKLAGFLKTLEYWPRDKFWDIVSGCLILCLEMLETSVLGLGQDLGLIMALGGAMTTSTYVSCIVFDLIPSRFKVRDMFPAYVTCMLLPLCRVYESYLYEMAKLEDVSRYCKGLVLALRLRNILDVSHSSRSFVTDFPYMPRIMGRRSLRGLIENQCGVSYGMIACSDVTKGNETQKPVSRMAKI